MMRKVISLPVHRCPFYHSQMPISPFTDAHLYVCRCRAAALPQACGSFTARQQQLYHRPVYDGKFFIEERNGLGSRLIMTKLGTLRSQFMKSSVYKGGIFHLCRETIFVPWNKTVSSLNSLITIWKMGKHTRHKENTNREYPLPRAIQVLLNPKHK